MRNQNNAFTTAEQLSRLYTPSSKLAFTMAEILISLTIIGVIAAITLPSLRANINEKTWATQRKALYSRMSQAIAMMPSLSGYGIGADNAETSSKASEVFVTDGLSKVLDINNICNYQKLSECGFSSKIKTLIDNRNINFPTKFSDLNPRITSSGSNTIGDTTYVNSSPLIDTYTAAFETKNGESVAVFYNPFCMSKNDGIEHYFVQHQICVNFVYDMNGKRGPNQVGRDIGYMTALYATDSEVVSSLPINWAQNASVPYNNARANCRKKDARVLSFEELVSSYANTKLIDVPTSYGFMSSTLGGDGKYRALSMYTGFTLYVSQSYYLCTKRN